MSEEKRLIPGKLEGLHAGEEKLRKKALDIVVSVEHLQFHLRVIECVMDLADKLRQYKTEDEDLKLTQVLGMRIFNAFAASFKLAMSGYHQNSALIIRDVLETVFLLDLFRREHSLIAVWRLAESRARWKQFSPVKVREALDAGDGVTGKKRAAHYALLSDLAGHPSMSSVFMMRPYKDGEAMIGPFIENSTLEAILSEMGKLAVMAGEVLNTFFPANWAEGASVERSSAAQSQAGQVTTLLRRPIPDDSGLAAPRLLNNQ